jgi:hypothetical protein
MVIKGYPTVMTGPTSTPSSTSGNTGSGNAGTGNTGSGGPAVGSTWHVVACSSVQNTDNTGAG